MALTEQQLKAMLGIGDVGGEEDSLTQQMALADKLRANVTGIEGGRTGGNIGRAAYGIAAAMKDYRNAGAATQVSAKRRALLEEILKRNPNYTPAPYQGGIPTPPPPGGTSVDEIDV